MTSNSPSPKNAVSISLLQMEKVPKADEAKRGWGEV
jgi:hypothetical protein